jgi:predicted dehydrogenase
MEADRILEAVRKNKVKLQVAHQMRVSPYTLRAKAMIEAGEIGDIHELRARGKEDRRAGGEDLIVLGSHLMDLMRVFLGDPRWVTAHVTSSGEEMSARHVKQATEPLGPIAGNQISAMFAFGDGVHGYFASRAAAHTDPSRFGVWIYGSRGVLFLPMAIYPAGGLHLLRSPAWLPDDRIRWERIEAAPDAASQAVADRAGRDVANALMVADLLRAIEHDGKPVCNEADGRWTIEMIHGVYRAQEAGARVPFPLAERSHPLGQDQH